jgi:hypothetical protein
VRVLARLLCVGADEGHARRLQLGPAEERGGGWGQTARSRKASRFKKSSSRVEENTMEKISPIPPRSSLPSLSLSLSHSPAADVGEGQEVAHVLGGEGAQQPRLAQRLQPLQAIPAGSLSPSLPPSLSLPSSLPLPPSLPPSLPLSVCLSQFCNKCVYESINFAINVYMNIHVCTRI